MESAVEEIPKENSTKSLIENNVGVSQVVNLPKFYK